MPKHQTTNQPKPVYRVDKYVVPPRALAEFIDKTRKTHDLLRALPGFVQDFVLEQSSGPGEFNFVTIVEWKNLESVEKAKSAVSALHRKMRFNPQKTFAQLGIKADRANYLCIDTQRSAHAGRV